MMQRVDEEGEDVFFNTYENFRLSTDSSDSIVCESHESVSGRYEYDVLARELLNISRMQELMSVSERRSRFLRGTGLDEFLTCQDLQGAGNGCTRDMIGSKRVRDSSGAVLDPLSIPDHDGSSVSECCIKDLDSGKRFIVQDLGQDGLCSTLKEVGSETLMTVQEFEALLGLSYSVQHLMRKGVPSSREERNDNLEKQKIKSRSWWRSFMSKKRRMGMCKTDVSVKNVRQPGRRHTRGQQRCKRCLEYSALYMGQEIQAHKGSIRVMRFSPSGSYLASGGEDCIVRVWQVGEVEASCMCFAPDGSSTFGDKSISKRLRVPGNGGNPAPLVIPEKMFKIQETPVHEFSGHTSDILDLSWSNADCLLTSSKDKTVRMWKVGCTGCLKVFQHNDYVTCIQFNPVDDRYFITGSIDGKVRVWGVPENRVVDWVDIRDIVTAVCYRPDGKGFVVGSITGRCRFYDYSDNTFQLGIQFCIQGKKKSAGKRITGLQFSPENSERVMVTSADSKVRIFNGVDVIHKFKGRRKTKSQLSASFTSDGRHIVSVGEDSHVYIWNHKASGSSSSKRVKSIRSCERFFSEGVSVAVPWHGADMKPDLSSGNLPLPFPLTCLDSSNWRKDSESYYLGALLLVDGLSRVSSTWPEEKLPKSPSLQLQVRNPPSHCNGGPAARCLKSQSSPWSLVIVTASFDGSIRCFHNYGLPVRLPKDLPKSIL